MKQELTPKELYEKEKLQREKTFNGMTAREWTINSRSVWNDLSSQRKGKHLKHGATYPEKLSDRIIQMYSKEGDTILDPFLGTGTTLVSAAKLNRNGIGIELSEEYYGIAKQSVESNYGLLTSVDIKIINDDCSKAIKKLDDESIQLTFTSPPYADLIHKVLDDREKRHKNSTFVVDNNSTTKLYSTNENDLGNMSFDEYLINVKKIMKSIYKKTKLGGYNIWVVKDYRDTKNGIPYMDLHSAIANAGMSAGFMYQDLIIWDQNEQRSLVLLGYPSVFYVNQNHSFIVVLRKKYEK